MPATVTLKVTHGRLQGEEFTFTERNTCILGRADGCTPRLPDDADHRTVSRHHCLLDINPPDIRVRDFGSLNGTYVNDVKIGQREAHQTPEEAAAQTFPEHDLTDGDELKIGSTTFRVSVHTPLHCVGCGREIPDGAQAEAGAEAGTIQCAACRARAARRNCPASPAPVSPRCAACGEPLAGARRAGPGSDLCAVCLADPGKVLRHLLRRARSGDRELAAIGGYTLLRELGRGGMGAVYLARDDTTGHEVALKVMLPRVAAQPDVRARFLREIAISKELRHRHIVSLHDIGTAHGGFYFTLEYCAGGSLDKLVARRGGRLPLDEALPLALQALEGLEHAHDQGVVHRDLSPQNILLTDGTSPVAKVGDFGLAKAFDQAGLSGLTRTGTAAGKPWFMPRQQVINFKHAQPDVDVWALAACLYWTLTGAHPRDFTGRRDPWQVVLQNNPVPIRKHDPTIPAGLAQVIDQALRDQPAIGFSTAAELRHALDKYG
ncbi:MULTISPECIES: protein kinase domain-containing protein [unclassified Pseudofrankia]|uniref:protein kinase domain-containing protein n=1 Tax=unclassified Pseudofrankia TaxID=2994372 RepID=UPI0008D8F3F3|nr:MULTISPECIES: protein kinase [unclassified Pseudofrankia]MDT3442753.1 protein kinase [Pseudofrankia sp. BMG5.37]OHV44206.1 serine/threonine protein kinase [Pseudofrankia sp. BMG5.36]